MLDGQIPDCLITQCLVYKMLLSSSHNPRLQRVRALLEKKKQRDEEQAFVVEGVRLVEEALASGWQAELASSPPSSLSEGMGC